MERYFLKYVKSDGMPGKRAMNWETICEAVDYAVGSVDDGKWIGWALYEVPLIFNWNITPPESEFVLMFCTGNWMKLI